MITLTIEAWQDQHKLPQNLVGKLVPRCQHVLLPSDRKSRAPEGPRQCRRTAQRKFEYCDQHIKRHLA